MVKYADFTRRIAGEGADAWKIHDRALDLVEQGEDIILLSLGEPDFSTPEHITASVMASLERGETHYTDFAGIKQLREAIARMYSTLGCESVQSDNVVVMSGAQNALYAALHCLVNPGDEVVTTDPRYVTYEGVIGAVNAVAVTAPMNSANGFRFNPETLEAAVSGKTRAVLLNSPHNPTGACLDAASLDAIADICLRHDLWLICDEVYGGLVYEQSQLSILSHQALRDRAVVVSSLSKSHAMSGWRLGWLVGPEALVGHIVNMVIAMQYGTPTFVQHAAIDAVNSGAAIEYMVGKYRERRDILCDRLARVEGLHCPRPPGGMFVMVDIRGSGLSAQNFAEILLEDYGVSVLAGEAFGEQAAGHIRLSLGMESSRLGEAADRISACFEALRSRKAPE